MAEIPKTMKELSRMGVLSSFGEVVGNFQKNNELGSIEMINLLQSYQSYLIEMIIYKCKEQEDGE